MDVVACPCMLGGTGHSNWNTNRSLIYVFNGCLSSFLRPKIRHQMEYGVVTGLLHFLQHPIIKNYTFDAMIQTRRGHYARVIAFKCMTPC